MNWESLTANSIHDNDYESVARFYENLLQQEPDNLFHYWYLGLSYLLQGLEGEAQGVWLSAITDNPDADLNELIDILEREAQRQLNHEHLDKAWLIRANILEINPALSNNNLEFIDLAFDLDTLDLDNIINYPVNDDIDITLLERVLSKLFNVPHENILIFAENNLKYIKNKAEFINSAFGVAMAVSTDKKSPAFSAEIMRLCLKLEPDDFLILEQIFNYYTLAENWDKALKTAHYIHNIVKTQTLKLYANYLIISVLMRAGMWIDIEPVWQDYQQLINQLLKVENLILEPEIKSNFLNIVSILAYLDDRAEENRYIINFIASLFQQQIIPITGDISKSDKLKIGYLAHTLRAHSVGWLSRWLIYHHNREQFEIYIYTINQPEDYITQKYFRNPQDNIRHFPYTSNSQEIAERIKADNLDILVELDSLTHNLTCQIIALKPAPVQITWLGSDASGIPTIDYFIADPYVLPDNAQDYYREKIWRLSHTYLGIDGFEVGTPTLRREDLEIEDSAVIYLSVQSGLKRNPQCIDLQMRILHTVPNSYFLIKGMGKSEGIQELFISIAEKQGVNPNRLRFLAQDKDEATHRANLKTADIVLDTYPYNGATTTLEVLWMAIPLVTRVGQQFAARNSYTFMINAGIQEGIAWTDEEYVRWGIELGNNARLRSQITDRLDLSKRNSPLWNGSAFATEMEAAYRQIRNKVV